MTFLFVYLINNHIYKKYNQKNKLFMVDVLRMCFGVSQLGERSCPCSLVVWQWILHLFSDGTIVMYCLKWLLCRHLTSLISLFSTNSTNNVLGGFNHLLQSCPLQGHAQDHYGMFEWGSFESFGSSENLMFPSESRGLFGLFTKVVMCNDQVTGNYFNVNDVYVT